MNRCILLLSISLFVGILVRVPWTAAADGKSQGSANRHLAPERTETAPSRIISYDESSSPEWKATWDQARRLYRNEKYKEALIQYEILLNSKGNISEARWEYATILVRLQRWSQACAQLDKLLFVDPADKKYLFALGDAGLHCGQTEKALRIFSQLYEAAPDGPEAQQALEGLVRARELLGDAEATLPLLEKLIEMCPENNGLRERRVRLLLELGATDKAGSELAYLEKNDPDNIEVLRMQARLYRQSGNADLEAAYLQRLVAREPDNPGLHRSLSRYYADRANWSMSLRHLEALLKQVPNDPELLAEAAEMNVRLGRFDNALRYYDYCLALEPDNTDVLRKKNTTRKLLARELLVLVQNAGSEKLWRDLVKVTPDRPAIYREIAALLREQNQTGELIEVLTLLYLEDPADAQTYRELAVLLEQNGRAGDLRALENKGRSGDERNTKSD